MSFFRIGFVFLVLLCSLALIFVNAGCGDDDDDDSAGPSTQDDDQSDDDSSDDDDDDDSSDDDDDVTGEYDSLRCPLPDPEGIGEGLTIGGGPALGTVTAYVYDNKTCGPLADGAAAVNGQSTDGQGKVVLSVDPKANPVTATAEGRWSWSYNVDAAVMYFRLREADDSTLYGDTEQGSFSMDGGPLPYANPQGHWGVADLIEFLNTPIHFGAAFPGLARDNLLNISEQGLLPHTNYSIFISYGQSMVSADIPSNIYIPEMDLVVGLNDPLNVSINGGNQSFRISYDPANSSFPVEAFGFSLTLGKVFSAETIIAVVGALIDGGDTGAIVAALLPALLDDVIEFTFCGVEPEWDGNGTLDVGVRDISSSETTISFIVENTSPGDTWMGIVIGEVENRALWPIGMGTLKNGEVEFPVAEIPGTGSIAMAIKSPAGGSSASLTAAATLLYVDSIDQWQDGIQLDADTDNIIEFDSATTYDDAGLLSWSYSQSSDVDAHMILLMPDDGTPTGVALVPGDADSFDCAAQFGHEVRPEKDVAILFALDLPEGTSVEEYDPTAFMAYDAPAFALWINQDIEGLIENLF